MAIKYKQGWGEPSSGIAIVGEAMGGEEHRESLKAKRMIPFIGASGKHMDRCLTATGFRTRLKLGSGNKFIGLKENGMRVTNVIKAHPNKNDIKPYVNLWKKEPEISDVAQEHIELLREELSDPQITTIVPMGNVALYALTGILGTWKNNARGAAITNYWRSVLPCTLVPGKKVIPCIHPAAALRGDGLYTLYITRTLKLIKRQAKFPEIDNPDRELLIRPSYFEALGFIERMIEEKKLVAHDIETAREQITCISFANDGSEAMCIPFVDEGFRRYYTDEEEEHLWSRIKELLEREDILKVAHNAAYEHQYHLETKGIQTKALHDTMIMQRQALPDMPASLGFCVAWYIQEPYYKDEDDLFLEGIEDIETYWSYNAKDSAVLIPLFEALHKELLSIGNYESYLDDVLILPVLGMMQQEGVNCDVEAIKRENKEGWISWWKQFKELSDSSEVWPVYHKDHKIFLINGERWPEWKIIKKWPSVALKDADGKKKAVSIMKLRKKLGAENVELIKGSAISKSYKVKVQRRTGSTVERKHKIFCVDNEMHHTFPNSDKQKRNYFYDYLGIPPYKAKDPKAKDPLGS
jgi:uracil-DNA glycosylase